MSYTDPTGLKLNFKDKGSEALFNSLRNSSRLTSGMRGMLDRLEQSKSEISIGQSCEKPPMAAVLGRTTGFKGSKDSEIELWIGGNGIYDQSVLLHELVHANQILNGIKPGEDLSEAAAYDVGFRFINGK